MRLASGVPLAVLVIVLILSGRSSWAADPADASAAPAPAAATAPMNLAALSMADLETQLAESDAKAKLNDPGSVGLSKRIAKELEVRIARRISDLETENMEWMGRHRALAESAAAERVKQDEARSALIEKDEAARTLKDRMAAVEKDLDQLRQQLKDRLAALPEAKALDAGERERAAALAALQAERARMASERRELNGKLKALRSRMAAALPPRTRRVPVEDRVDDGTEPLGPAGVEPIPATQPPAAK